MTLGKSNKTTKTFQVVKPFLRKKFPVTLQREERDRLLLIPGIVKAHVTRINYDFQPEEDKIRYVEVNKGSVNRVKRLLKERKYKILGQSLAKHWRIGDYIIACIPEVLYSKDLKVWSSLGS